MLYLASAGILRVYHKPRKLVRYLRLKWFPAKKDCMPEANSLIHSKQPAQLAEFPAGVIFFFGSEAVYKSGEFEAARKSLPLANFMSSRGH